MSDIVSSTGGIAAMILAATPLAKPLVEMGVKMMGDLLGKPVKVASNLLSDEVYCWQTVNRIKWAADVSTRLTETGVNPKVLPKGFLLPVVEAVGNVEDEFLRTWWVRLTTSGVKSEKVPSPSFSEAMKRLTPEDAKAFEEYARHSFYDGASFSFHRDSPTDLLIARLVANGLMEQVYRAELKPRPGTRGERLHVLGSNFQRRKSYVVESPRDFDIAVFIQGARVSAFGREFYDLVCKP